jgi:hypothetical protein
MSKYSTKNKTTKENEKYFICKVFDI